MLIFATWRQAPSVKRSRRVSSEMQRYDVTIGICQAPSVRDHAAFIVRYSPASVKRQRSRRLSNAITTGIRHVSSVTDHAAVPVRSIIGTRHKSSANRQRSRRVCSETTIGIRQPSENTFTALTARPPASVKRQASEITPRLQRDNHRRGKMPSDRSFRAHQALRPSVTLKHLVLV